MENLAAAYAENRQFDEAIKWQRYAMELSRDDGQESRLKLYQQKKPFRDLNRKEPAFSDISDLLDKVTIELGQKLDVQFKVNEDQLIEPKATGGRSWEPNALSLNFQQEKRGRTLRLSHSFARTIVARCLARLKDYDAYFEADILPVPIKTISPEIWHEPIEELVLFDFKLTAPGTPDDDGSAAITSTQLIRHPLPTQQSRAR